MPLTDASEFALYPQLAADTHDLGKLGLSQALLMNDASFPWLILVPRRPDLREIVDLEASERAALMDEIVLASDALRAVYRPDKLNVAALGNMVAQLHVHVIARFTGDAAWPAPVWGAAPPRPYAPDELSLHMTRLHAALRLGAE